MIYGITVLAGIWACDSLSDPAKPASVGPDASTTTQVSGALVGPDAPANTRVALVWQTAQALTPGADAPVVAGRFTMSLDAPPTGTVLNDLDDVLTDHPALGTNTVPLARAGFVVYVDLNANQKLDLDAHGVASDQVLSGNASLVLTYVSDRAPSDYANLRDDTKAVPHAGYNLMARIGDTQVWSSLDRVDLLLDRSRLPSTVCKNLRTRDDLGLRRDAGSQVSCDWTEHSFTLSRCWTYDSPSLCADNFVGAPQCYPDESTHTLVPDGGAMPASCE